MRGFLPNEIIEKSKHGFGLPFGEWLKTSDRLQELIYSMLGSLGERRIVRAEFIDSLIAQHRSGHAGYYGTAVWVFMALESWLVNNTTGKVERDSSAPGARGDG
jgi:asparagine synthase (glutamine-hydrolysing)